jgi:hypothetical protein
MRNKEQKDIWQDMKDIWNKQPQSEKINIQVSELIAEFKSKISQFEKDLIYKDIAFIESSTSQFEKKLIQRDINLFTSLLKKMINKFRMKK